VSETGVIKFQAECIAREEVRFSGLDDLNELREQLMEFGWLGVDQHGVGFGNISVRDGATKHFCITGSGTGDTWRLKAAHLARVIDYDFGRNSVRYEGLILPSSESLTHAAVYEACADGRAVIHCHSPELWKALINVAPTTSADVKYGTPEMAQEVLRLFRTTDVVSRRIFVMAGHQGGIASFGTSLADAYAALTS